VLPETKYHCRAAPTAALLRGNTTTTPDYDRLRCVPTDEDTFVRAVSFATVGGIPVRFEKWICSDVTGRSAIFLSEDVGAMTNAEIVRILQDAGVNLCGTITFSRKDTFAFVNFDFHDD
jgi:hypothetical protein